MNEIEKEKKRKEIFEMFKEVINTPYEIMESELDEDGMPQEGYHVPVCPKNICDGTGFIKSLEDGKNVSTFCQCYLDSMMENRLRASNIEQKYWTSDIEKLDSTLTSVELFSPKLRPEPRKIDKRKKEQDPEHPDVYIDRIYDRKNVKQGIQFYGNAFVSASLKYIEQTPRQTARNLILLGEPGRGKTYFACAIGKEFLKKEKSVYYTRMRTLLDNAFENKSNIRSITETVDLLIIDELGHEYHTDTSYSLKQIQEIVKIRHDKNLPIIFTTNFYPNELHELYGKSLMSMINGEFIISHLHSEIDNRLLSAHKAIDDLGLFDGE